VGTALGLYNIYRNKTVRFPCTIIYSKQATDNELMHFLKSSIQDSLEHINTIRSFLEKNGINTPTTEELEKSLNDDSSFYVPRSLMDDKKISSIMREFLRLSLTIEAEGLRNATEHNAKKIIFDILHKDNEANEKLIRLQEDKGWDDFPPYLSPQ
jgi:hypothetical protein